MDEEAQAPIAPVEMPWAPAVAVAVVQEGAVPQGGGAWLLEGARLLAFRRPHWAGLDARPLTLAVLVLADYLLIFGVQRALVSGTPTFIWQGIFSGWASTAVTAWLCWLVVRSRAARQTCTPSRANSCAIEAPMPRLAPVTKAVLPRRFRSIPFHSR